MKNNLKKDDKQFLVEITLYNRDFLTTCANLILFQLFAFTAVMLSICSIIISIFGVKESIIPLIVIIIPLILYWWWSIKQYKQIVKNVKNVNEQYQKYFFEIYPKLKKKGFYH